MSNPGAARRQFEQRRAFRDKIKWRTGSQGRINHLKRSYGWNRTHLTGLSGARICADTASSPTTSSNSATWPHETHAASNPHPQTAAAAGSRPLGEPFFRS